MLTLYEIANMMSACLEHIDIVTSQDLNGLGRIRLKLLPQPSALAATKRTLEGLDAAHRRWIEILSHHDLDLIRCWDELIENRGREVTSYTENAVSLLQKCEMASQHLAAILEFNNRSLASEQQRIARQQNDRVYLLTKFTVDDSITVRVVTAISLVFLSVATVGVSFSSGSVQRTLLTCRKTIFSMPLFYPDIDSHRLAVSPSIWIFVLCCIILTSITLGYWRWRLIRRQRQRLKLLEGVRETC